MSTATVPRVAPLPQIEQRVQARAKDLQLDLGTDEGRAGLRGLIDEEIAAYRTEYRLGHQPVDMADPATASAQAWRNLVGYGPLESLLDDDDVWEIMINSPTTAFAL